MPSVLAASTLVDHRDVFDLPTEPPRARRALQGFWRTLTQYVAWLRVRRTRHVQHLCAVSYRFETPAELFARQYPSSYFRGFSGF
jgi:hypothetical protein